MFSQYLRDKCCDSVAVTFQISIFCQHMQMRASCGTNAFDLDQKEYRKNLTNFICTNFNAQKPRMVQGRKPSVQGW